ncbi:MAG: hypothetical protein ACYC35_05190 [Pirellulales bacterium]
MAVLFEELAGSPTWSVRDGRATATRVFKVAWEDRFDFVRDLWGGYWVVGNRWVYVLPATFPDLAGALVTDVHVELFDPDAPTSDTFLAGLSSGTNVYSHARVTATYRNLPGDDRRAGKPAHPEGTVLTFSSDLSAEYQTIPGRTWEWNVAGSPDVPADINPGILVPAEDLELTWHRVPRPPWDAIRDLRGKVNASAFMGHAPETVLFLGARAHCDCQIFDTGLWKLEYHFKVKEVQATADSATLYGWNRFYREEPADGEHWLEIQTKGATKHKPYTAGDFAALFQFG